MDPKHILKLPSILEAEALNNRLRAFEPWSVRVDFDCGVSTRDFRHRTPFAENTLQKFNLAARNIPFNEMAEATLLDIGCASGYNAMHATVEYGLHSKGIDFNPRHIERADFLSHNASIPCEFAVDSAETFLEPDTYDVVLHFGCLYHLKNPLLSLENTFKNLKSGGYLALETQIYEHPEDENICYFMRGQNNDLTNYWALSNKVLVECLELMGFGNIETILKVSPQILEEHMSRIVLTARKP